MFFFLIRQRSSDTMEEILAIEEDLVGGLGIAYRVVVHRGPATLGPSAAKKVTTSRLGSRARSGTGRSRPARPRPISGATAERSASGTGDGSAPVRAHLERTAMTRGSDRAPPRPIRTKDGHVAVPEVLHPYGAPEQL